MLLGAIVFINGAVTFALVNYNLFEHMTKSAPSTGLKVPVLLVVCVIAIDVLAGQKFSLVLEGVIVGAYWCFGAALYRQVAARRVFLVGSLIVMLVVIAYPYVNPYRVFLRESGSLSEAFYFASNYVEPGTFQGLLAILSRVNGLDNFLAAQTMGGAGTFPVTAMLNSDFLREFTAFALAADAKASFGLTQFGILHSIGGTVAVYAGAAVFGAICRGILYGYMLLASRSLVSTMAIVPVVIIMLVQVMMGAGALSLFSKEFAMVAMAIYALERRSVIE